MSFSLPGRREGLIITSATQVEQHMRRLTPTSWRNDGRDAVKMTLLALSTRSAPAIGRNEIVIAVPTQRGASVRRWNALRSRLPPTPSLFRGGAHIGRARKRRRLVFRADPAV
jgi:hypothetical protein